jgi:hypothetical protein
MIDGYKTFYLDALYTNNKQLYVDIAELFAMLNISCQSGKSANTLTGFIERENQTYLIDYEKGILKVGNRVVQSSHGLVKDKGILYLESTLFSDLFGITLNFNYRALTIQLKSKFELPFYKQQRIEKIRNSLSMIKGEEPADTILQRKYHLMKFGALDWSIATTQSETGAGNNQLALAVGTEILYGEADLSVNYYDRQKFDNRQLFYMWRWVDNDKPIIKQAQLGILSNQTISYINAPVIGFSIRNAPTTLRKATGYYSVNEYTEPNWDVELYINNVLIDYTKADASGLYHFKVPIVYGYTTLKFKFYGPMGEEKTVERTMNVPYTIMPAKEFEYAISAGIVENSNSSRFARGELNYGVNRFLTIGGGVEHLSSITNGANIPFLMATIQPFSKLTLNAEYAHGVRTGAYLNYYFKKDISLDLTYTRYVKGQTATIMNATEERKARLSVPFNYKTIRGYVRLDYTQLVYNTFKYNQTNMVISAYYKLLSANSSTQVDWINGRSPNITSDLTLMYRIGTGYTIRPSIQYNSYNNVFTMYKVILEKQITKGDCSISYEKNISSNTTIINVNFRYDLKFVRTNISVSQQNARPAHSENPGKRSSLVSENAQGSLVFGRGNKYIYTGNNSSVGSGGISFYPFLDMNQNGKFDKGESMVKLSTSGIHGKMIISEKDSILSISDLQAFTQYTIEFKDTGLPTIAWRFKKKRYRILVDPNQFKRIDIPIVPVGEVEGMAYLNTDQKMKGIGKILVNLYNKNNNMKIGQTLSESDGSIRYSGLEPGEYVARIDSVQLVNLNYTPLPKQNEFTIRSLKDGDLVNKIDFVLESAKENTPLKMAMSSEQMTVLYKFKSYDVHDLLYYSINKKVRMIVRDTMIYLKRTILYDVQLYTSHEPIKPEDLFTHLIAKVPGIKIMEMAGKDGLYHYSTGVFLNPDEAYAYFQYIREKGWMYGYVSIYTGGKRKAINFKP